MNEQEELFEIDLLEIAKAILHRWWIVVISFVLGAAIFASCAIFLITPLYKSSVMMYVNNSTINVGSAAVSITSGELSAAKTLVDTYCVILTTRLTLEDVIEKAELDYTYEELKEMITAGSEKNTEIFRITVTSSNPDEACKIANTIAMVLPEKISNVVSGSSVKAVDLAVVPEHRSSPSYSKYTAIGAILGTVVSCAAIAVISIFSDTVNSSDWLIDSFKNEYPLLSVIPGAGSKHGKYYRYQKYSYGGSYGKNG